MDFRMKKLTKPSVYVTSCIFIFMALSLNVFSETIDEVYIAAYDGLDLFLNSIPVGFEKQYGFKNRKEFNKTALGEPYHMHTIYPQSLAYGTPFDNEYIVPLTQWRFPVICEGKIRALLTVSKINGIWRAVDIGAARLATELDMIEKTFINYEQDTKKVLLRLYQIKADFVLFYEKSKRIEEGMLFPLQSGYMAIGGWKKGQAIFSFKDLLPILKKKYKSIYFDLRRKAQFLKRKG